MRGDKVEVENPNTPDRTSFVNRAKYNEMRAAYLRVLSNETPGMTAAEIKDATKPHLSPELFPDGKTSGWWAKTVQLDLEAKGIVARSPTKPLRFFRAD